MKKLAVLLILLTLLTGCSSISGKSDIIDLLSSPKLSQRESEVVETIKEHFGENIILKYPKQGNNISPVQIVSLFDNGQDQAVVLYNAPNYGGNVRIAILTKVGKEWQVVFDADGYGTDVYKLQVTKLFNNEAKQLAVCYTFANTNEKFLSIYHLEDQEVVETQTESCQEFTIYDVTGDGTDDIVLAEINTTGKRPTLQVLSGHYDSLFTKVASYPINADNSVVTNISLGHNDYAGQPVIFFDYKDSYKRVYTEAVYLDAYELKSLLVDVKVQKIWNFSYNLVSADVDADGYIEVPSIITNNGNADSAINFMEWTSYASYPVVRKFFGIGDGNNAVFIAMPNEWQNYIKIVKSEDIGAWQVEQIEDGEILINVQVSVSASDETEKENTAIVNKGTVKVEITFSEKVSPEQRKYISENVIFLR